MCVGISIFVVVVWLLSRMIQVDARLKGRHFRTFKPLTDEQIRQRREDGCNCGPGKRVDDPR